MAFICVFASEEVGLEEARAAVRIHGFYDSMKEARQSIDEFALEQSDVQSYIIEECMRWVAVQDPVKGTGVEEEEIRAPENEDRQNGRMGSVCDLRARKQNILEPTPTTGSPDDPVHIFDASDKPNSISWKQKQVRTQCDQLDHLLRGEVVACITNTEQYAAARDRLALLRAFRRKLQTLIKENLQKCHTATVGIAGLESKFPMYRDEFLKKYKQALKESGITEQNVAFMDYLSEEV